MELIVGFLLELLIEVLFAAVVGLFEVNVDGQTERRVQRALALAAMGVGLGVASTLVLPEHFLGDRSVRVAWLGVAPLLGGLVIAGFGAAVRWGQDHPWRWSKFVQGAMFIGCLNATRFAMLG